MDNYSYREVTLLDGFLKDKETLNRTHTIPAVYNRFYETGRIAAFEFDKEKTPDAHFFWDSDVAKWMEGAAYSLYNYPDDDLKAKVEALIDNIEKHQCEDGYFNIYFTIIAPEARFTNRDWHELYCAGHLIEAAVAYAEATGEERFLRLMEKYALYIKKVFMDEKSAPFHTSGHEEIELALVKLYRYTKKREYLDLAVYFINTRGTTEGELVEYNQSEMPVREMREAKGHSVRATYLYTAMADLAYELNDRALYDACKALFGDIYTKKMYITGGIGSCYIGEAFSNAYDLPNEEAYAETCAGIGMIFFAQRMQRIDTNACYADIIERILYNGLLSGVSLDGEHFFYENPLEINLTNHFTSSFGSKRYPITQRPELFWCSCCPPNVNRILASLGGLIFSHKDDILFVNQFTSAKLDADGVKAEMHTKYPLDGEVEITVSGKAMVAFRLPTWCAKFKLDRPYSLYCGYALVENDGTPIHISFDITPFTVEADSRIPADIGKVAVQCGPVIYCAEAVDNRLSPQHYSIAQNTEFNVSYEEQFGLNVLDCDAYVISRSFPQLYFRANSNTYDRVERLHLIPYSCFANRGETDMAVWFRRK